MSLDLGVLIGGLLAGFLAGLIYFASLWRAARSMVAAGQPGRALLTGPLLRLPAMLALLALAAQFGISAIGGVMIGFLGARIWALRRPPACAG